MTAACVVWLVLAALLGYGLVAVDRTPVLVVPGQLLPQAAETFEAEVR